MIHRWEVMLGNQPMDLLVVTLKKSVRSNETSNTPRGDNDYDFTYCADCVISFFTLVKCSQGVWRNEMGFT